MQTKLVYVLTCAPEATYIEQALISIWSARYHNPNAHIVLLVDDLTDQLLVDKRAEVLEYITEKVVIPFEDANATMMYRSRFLKTSVRQLVKGDFLFLDCDTIITQCLAEIDNINAEIAAVLDSNRHISEYQKLDKEAILNKASICGWAFDDLKEYRNSGVVYVKDTFNTHVFYSRWHENYFHTQQLGINIDQISLEQTSRDISIVNTLDNIWNAIMYVRPKFIEKAKVIHFLSQNNNSFLFSKRVLQYVRENALPSYLRYYILHPMESYIPYMKKYYTGLAIFKTIHHVAKGVKQYARYIDSDLVDLKITFRVGKLVKKLFALRRYYLGTIIWLFWIRFTGKYNSFEKYYQ